MTIIRIITSVEITNDGNDSFSGVGENRKT